MPINDTLDDIFGIPKDGSNIKEEADESQESSYAEVVTNVSAETFEQKAKKMSAVLPKNASNIEVSYVEKGGQDASKKETTQSTEQPKAEEKSKAAEQPRPVEQEKSKDSFKEILSKSFLGGEPTPSEVQPVVQKQAVDNQDTEPGEDAQEESETVSQVTPSYKADPDEDGWMLVAPSPMLISFYVEKQRFIRDLTKGKKPINVDKLLAELENSTVSIRVEISDLHGMSDKLTTIQSFLDRVVQIKILATGQCAACKRGVELLRGVLARVLHEKPAAKQDGIIYEHMRDVEMYAAKVESLEQSAKDVYHNLLEAKEILSRKLSISIELMKQQNLPNSLEKNYNALPDPVKQAIQASQKSLSSGKLAAEGFDSLEVQETVKAQNTEVKPPIQKKAGKLNEDFSMD